MDEKLSGSYYTPQKTIHFIYNYLQQQHKPIKSILEPSAGDGRFIRLFSKSNSVGNIVGVELYQEKVQAINERILSPKVTMIAADFLEYSSTCKAKFDLVVGNPPYINIKNMDKKFLEAARSLCQSLNLPESLIQNAWVAFVIAATQLLSKTGTVFFVLPTEFLQVQYAEKLRGFLEKKFNTIHILSFEERMFPEIEQEACLVYLTNENQGLPYISYRQYAKLDSKTPILESRIERNKPLKKWSNAVLSDEEIDLLNRITNQYTTIAKLSDSAPGIVTGANNKFILTKEEVDQYECAQYVKPIISKGVMAKNKFEVNHALISELASAGKKVYVLNTTIDGVLNRIIQLRIKISRQNALIRNIISRNQKEINDFLRYAGYHYTVSIEESEGKNYRLLLHYEDHREAINAVQAHLSYGERNALALLLFMYSIKRETPDLVILDDPISSFDGNKKFAIVNMLFKEPGYLRGKTVLLLTHEFGTVVDMVHTMKRNFGAVSTAAFLSTRNGVLQEQQIHADDIKAYPAIAEKNIAESTDPLNKLIYLRRLMEFENNKNDAWQLLSNVFHVGDGTREAPMKCIGNGIEIPMTPDEVQKGTEDIKKYILDFDYQMAYQRMEDQNLLISLYDSTEANYEKLQIYRLIFIGRPMNVVVQKFVNETYHVENDYMFQLDPRIYDTVPQYIVDVCNQAINELRTVQPA